MKIQMELLSDAIFGNGVSIPGGEDISILCDEYGFPYFKGGTLKGIFREELERYLSWTGEENLEERMEALLGKGGADETDEGKLVFADFQLSAYVKAKILEEIGEDPDTIQNALSHVRTFTRIDENGKVQEGSLRSCRCVDKGLVFYSDIECAESDETLVLEVLGLIKWIGTMRNRGFGKVRITKE